MSAVCRHFKHNLQFDHNTLIYKQKYSLINAHIIICNEHNGRFLTCVVSIKFFFCYSIFLLCDLLIHQIDGATVGASAAGALHTHWLSQP